MNYRAHKIGGVCTGIVTSALLFKDNPNPITLVSSLLLIAGASFGSIAPDIDKSTTKIGKNVFLKPISLYIQKKYGHRTITHSLLVSLAMLSLLICSSYMFRGLAFYLYSNLVIAFSIGYMSHLLLDFLTTQGIPLFYPFDKTKYKLCKFKTSKHEDFVSALCLVVTGFLLYIILKWWRDFYGQ